MSINSLYDVLFIEEVMNLIGPTHLLTGSTLIYISVDIIRNYEGDIITYVN